MNTKGAQGVQQVVLKLFRNGPMPSACLPVDASSLLGPPSAIQCAVLIGRVAFIEVWSWPGRPRPPRSVRRSSPVSGDRSGREGEDLTVHRSLRAAVPTCLCSARIRILATASIDAINSSVVRFCSGLRSSLSHLSSAQPLSTWRPLEGQKQLTAHRHLGLCSPPA